MLDVDQRGVARLSRVVPFACGRFPAGVLSRRDNFEVLVLQLAVEFLPAWQIEAASSPGGPGDYQHFLAAKIGEMHQAALAVRRGEIGRDARIHETTPQ